MKIKKMSKRKKEITAVVMAVVLGIASVGCAQSIDTADAMAALPPEAPSGGPGVGQPGGGNSSDISWSGAKTITSETSEDSQTYTSSSADENALLVDTSSGTQVTIKNPTVTKTGGTSASDDYSFYGINSAIMCKGGGVTTIEGGTITTDAQGANAVFSYGANSGQTNATGDGTTVNISDTTITTTGDGSGGIMTTYGGTTNASNLTITTSGGSSAPIRTDRGGGWVKVSKGTYTSNGQGSPAIYSTADVDVEDATLISNKSEGVCIEGNGSIELKNCDLTASNTTLNGKASFYDTIMIYQSMSGDATGTGSEFSMTGGTLTSKSGHTFHVTNTSATINLDSVDITNSSDDVLLSVCADGWSGNDNKATLNANNQTLSGDILVGSDSSLTVKLTGNSVYTGKISGDITDAKGNTISSSQGEVNVTLDSGSVWVLTGDCKVTSLSGTGEINYNGYTLTVGSASYSSGSIGDISETTKTISGTDSASDKSEVSDKTDEGNDASGTDSGSSEGTTPTKTEDEQISDTSSDEGNTSVNVGKTKVKKAVKNKNKKSAKITLKKVKDSDGYEIKYGISKSMKTPKKVTSKSVKKTIKGLKKNKTYYVRARAYKVINGVKRYGKWSAKVKCK